jgi:hypothetical protein
MLSFVHSRFPIYTLLFLNVSSAVWAAQACSDATTIQAKQQVKRVQRSLLEVKVGQGGMDSTVTPSTQTLIRSLKDNLVATTDDYMRCKYNGIVDVKAIEQALGANVEANTPKQPNDAAAPFDADAAIDKIYGDDLRVLVKRQKNRPELLSVEWSFGIDCGNDSLLIVYEHKNNAWQRVLRWQSGDYGEISGAFGDFVEYAFVPFGAEGRWAMAVAHGHPWCTSRWSAFDIDVIAPTVSSSQPRVLFHENAGYVRDVDPLMSFKDDGFDLHLEVGALDMDIMTRQGFYRYRTTGKKIDRIQPIAMNGRDFVDEWLQVKWSDAERWASAEHGAELRALHARIKYQMRPGAHDWPKFTFGAVRACRNGARHFQVEASEHPGGPLYFQILRGNNSFTMLSASTQSNPLCKGGDVMQKH